jgi:hypothetical protein
MVKNTIVKLTPEMVATFFVTTLMLAKANRTSVINPNPTGISRPAMWKLSGTFHSRPSGFL